MCLSHNVLKMGSLNDLLDLRGVVLEPILVCYTLEQTESGVKHSLHITSPNGNGYLLWLYYYGRCTLSGARRQAMAEAFFDAPKFVVDELKTLGYPVRTGIYGIDKNIEPIRGVIDCLNFTTDKHGNISAVALEPEWRIFPEEIF